MDRHSPIVDEVIDADSDGYLCTDCNDNDASINPGAAEILYNGNDDDCNVNTPDYAWTSATIDSNGTVGANNSIALDNFGNVHIAYCDTTNGALKYATNASGSWATSTVVNMCSGSIAVDKSGKVHMVYFVSGEGLKYGTNASGSWVISTIDSAAYSISIAVDLNNSVHISYGSGSGIKYATNASGSWTTEVVSSDGFDSSIAVDSFNKAHIIYEYKCWYDLSCSRPAYLYYVTNASGLWVESLIATVEGVAEGTIGSSDIAVDSSGNRYIIFTYSAGDLTYGVGYESNVSSSCLPSINYDGHLLNDNSIAIDTAGKIHILYAGQYITNNSCPGTTQTMSIGSNFSAAIDISGYVHISYYDTVNQDLKYATNAPDPLSVDNDADGYSENQNDCNDRDPLERPNQTWYLDADDDGYSEGTTNTISCTRPAGYKAATELLDISLDCDDSNSVLNPGTLWHPDFDLDGYGNPSVSMQQCTQPEGYILDGTDCNDSDADLHPGGYPVRIPGSPPVYFTTLQAAYDAAGEGGTIQVQATAFSENININLNKSVTLNSGYNCGYTAIADKTILNGSMTISSGTVTIENFVLQ